MQLASRPRSKFFLVIGTGASIFSSRLPRSSAGLRPKHRLGQSRQAELTTGRAIRQDRGRQTTCGQPICDRARARLRSGVSNLTGSSSHTWYLSDNCGRSDRYGLHRARWNSIQCIQRDNAPDRSLTATALIPAIFLGAAIVFSVAYIAFLKQSSTQIARVGRFQSDWNPGLGNPAERILQLDLRRSKRPKRLLALSRVCAGAGRSVPTHALFVLVEQLRVDLVRGGRDHPRRRRRRLDFG